MKLLILFIVVFNLDFDSTSFQAYGSINYHLGPGTNFELLDPLVFNDSTYRPFYYAPNHKYYDRNDDLYLSIAKKENLNQWYNYYLKRSDNNPLLSVIEDDIDSVIYSYPIDHIFKSRLPLNHKKNRFLIFVRSKREILEYLIFAKRCEYQFHIRDPWGLEPHDFHAMEKLIKVSKEKYSKISDKFLKFRYAYQMVLLARYSENYESCVQIFDDYLEPLKMKGPLYYWALHHKAFALLKLNRQVEANLASTKVFENAPSKRLRAFLYFDNKFLNPTILQSGLTNKEKALIKSIDLLQMPGPALDALKTIYSLNPKSKQLKFLVVREINKLESWIYANRYKKYDKIKFGNTIEIHLKTDLQHLKDLTDFISSVILEKNISDPNFWRLLRGHCYVLLNDYHSAKIVLATVSESELTNDHQKIQLQKSKLIAEIYSSPMDEKLDEKVYKSIKWFEGKKNVIDNYKSQLGHLLLFIGKYYEQNNQLPKALLFYNYSILKCRVSDLEHSFFVRTGDPQYNYYNVRYPYYFYYLDKYGNARQVESFLELIQKKNPNNLESALLNALHYDIHRIKDLKATIYFRNDNLSACYKILQEIPDSFWLRKDMPYLYYLHHNPFIRNYGYFLRHYGEADSPRYTKPEMVGKLIEYRQKAVSNIPNRSYYYFLLGNAYTNFSYYGKSWLMYAYLIRANDYSYMEDKPFARNYYRFENALYYYKRAYQTATSKKARAFIARMIIDTEKMQKTYLKRKEGLDEGKLPYQIKPYDLTKTTYYSVIKNSYPQYYDDLINDPHSYNSYLKDAFR